MPYTKDQIIAKIQAQANASGIDPAIGVAQARQESNFNPNAVSNKGAAGLFQFIPATAKRFGLTNPYDPDQSILAWSAYMSHLLQIFNGRVDLALAGYNWGEGSRTSTGSNYRGPLWQSLDNGDSVLNYSIPAETRNYVIVIMTSAGYDPNSVGSQAAGQSYPIDPSTGYIDIGDVGTINVTAPPLDDPTDNTKMILALVGLLVAGVLLASTS